MKPFSKSLRAGCKALTLAVLLPGVAGAQPPSRYGVAVSREREIDQSLSRFHALMAEGRYQDAEALAAATGQSQPGLAAARCAELTARLVRSTATMSTLRDMRHKGYLDNMSQVELSHVPVPDQPPILYPNPEVWQLLNQRRRQYRAADVAYRGPNEQKILAALGETADIDFAERPLADVVDYLKQRYGIEIQLDNRALAAAGVDPAATITRSVKGVSLRSALKLSLRDLDLTFVIWHEVLLITSQSKAATMLSTRVYPVADLLNRSPYRGWGGRRVGLGGGMWPRPVVVGSGML